MPADPGTELAQLTNEQQHLETHLRELQTGTGRHHNTPTGEAAHQLVEARQTLERAKAEANAPGLSRRRSRKLDTVVREHRERLQLASQRWKETGEPIERQLQARLDDTEEAARTLDIRRYDTAFWQLQHPAARQRLQAINTQIAHLQPQAGIDRPEQHRPPPAIGGLSR